MVKQCKICQLGIDTDVESYVNLIDYKFGKFLMEGYYHNDCYRDKITMGQEQKKTLGMAKAILSKLSKTVGMKQEEEVYDVK